MYNSPEDTVDYWGGIRSVLCAIREWAYSLWWERDIRIFFFFFF